MCLAKSADFCTCEYFRAVALQKEQGQSKSAEVGNVAQEQVLSRPQENQCGPEALVKVELFKYTRRYLLSPSF